jgi:hypothetical protein
MAQRAAKWTAPTDTPEIGQETEQRAEQAMQTARSVFKWATLILVNVNLEVAALSLSPQMGGPLGEPIP